MQNREDDYNYPQTVNLLDMQIRYKTSMMIWNQNLQSKKKKNQGMYCV